MPAMAAYVSAVAVLPNWSSTTLHPFLAEAPTTAQTFNCYVEHATAANPTAVRVRCIKKWWVPIAATRNQPPQHHRKQLLQGSVPALLKKGYAARTEPPMPAAGAIIINKPRPKA